MPSSPSPLRRLAGELKRIPLLDGVGPGARAEILRRGHWFCLPSGAALERTGDHDRALFFVLAGALAVTVDGGDGASKTVADMGAGDTVGEISLLTGAAHTARLVARRDSELLCLPEPAFREIAATAPELLGNLAILLATRLARTTHRAVERRARKVVGIIPHAPGDRHRALAVDLARALERSGFDVAIATEADAVRGADWLHALEGENDVVLMVAETPDGAWTRRIERHADRLLIVASAGSHVPAPAGIAVPIEIVSDGPPGSLPMPHMLHHRVSGPRDVRRLARHLTDRALGLVFSGGGARGFAHVGVLEAIEAAGVEIDAIGGTSMGAIVAAGHAAGWSAREVRERMHAAFVARNPFTDVTLPLIAMFRGAKVERLLDQAFGATRIEDLALPFFCVTSDLTAGRDVAHRSGPLARALRASVSLPGLLPPVAFGDSIHVDGGVTNNLPVEHMLALSAGPVIACDVSGETALKPREGGRTEVPGLIPTLMRTGTIGNDWQRREARRRARLVIDPQVEHVPFASWKSFDMAVAAGRAAGEAALARYMGEEASRSDTFAAAVA